MSKIQFTRQEIVEMLVQNGYSLSKLQVSDNYEVFTKKDALPVRLYKQVLTFSRSDLKDLLPSDIVFE